MTPKMVDASLVIRKINEYVYWNERLSEDAREALRTVIGWLNNTPGNDMVSKDEHEKLLARFRHLMESPYIRSFDSVDIRTGKFKKDIRLAIGPDEKLIEDGLNNCAFCEAEAEIVSQKRMANIDEDFAITNTIMCKKCGALMKGKDTIYKINSVGGLECIKDGRHELIKAWNRRADP